MAYPYGTMNQQQMSNAFDCYRVGSKEEAIAARLDYFTAGLVMLDFSHDAIYLKRFNRNTGANDFYEFKLVMPEEKHEMQYVTVAEFEKFQKELSRRFGGKTEKEVIEDYE